MYWLRGEPRVARQCYREACLIDPAGIDWRHLQDEDLKELKQDLLLEYGLNPDLVVDESKQLCTKAESSNISLRYQEHIAKKRLTVVRLGYCLGIATFPPSLKTL